MKDKEIRKVLQSTILKRYYENDKCNVVEELNVCLGEARVDIAILNGSLSGFEIKSEFDNLNRLPSQLFSYLKVFDYVTIVTGAKHYEELIKIIPDCCGITCILKDGNKVKIQQLKKATKNDNKDYYSLCQLLWKDETILLLKEFGLTKKLNNKPKSFLWKLLAEQSPKQKLNKAVIETLKIREAWKECQPIM